MRLQLDMRQRGQGQLPVARPWTLQQAEHPIPTHHHRLQHRNREMPVDEPFLGKIADPGSMMTPQLVAGTIENLQRATHGSHEAENGPAERRLPGPVRTDHPDEFAALDIQGDVLEGDDVRREPERGVREANDARCRHT